MIVVSYKIGQWDKTKVCKDHAEAKSFCHYLKNMWGLIGTITEEGI